MRRTPPSSPLPPLCVLLFRPCQAAEEEEADKGRPLAAAAAVGDGEAPAAGCSVENDPLGERGEAAGGTAGGGSVVVVVVVPVDRAELRAEWEEAAAAAATDVIAAAAAAAAAALFAANLAWAGERAKAGGAGEL